MTTAQIVNVASIPGGPEVRLLDARQAGLDEAGLRAWARAETAASGAPYTARSYRYPYALIGWHSEPVGVDIERIEPCDAAFLESICTPAERAAPVPPDLDEHCLSLWCSKEALSKALGNALDYDPRRLGSPMLWPDGRAGRWQAAPLGVVVPGHVAWVCWRSREGSPLVRHPAAA